MNTRRLAWLATAALLIVAFMLLGPVTSAQAQSLQPGTVTDPVVSVSVNLTVTQATAASSEALWQAQVQPLFPGMAVPSLVQIEAWAEQNGYTELALDFEGTTQYLSINGAPVLTNVIGADSLQKVVAVWPGIKDSLLLGQNTTAKIALHFPNAKAPAMATSASAASSNPLVKFAGSILLTAQNKLVPGGLSTAQLGGYAPELVPQFRTWLGYFGITDADIVLGGSKVDIRSNGVTLDSLQWNPVALTTYVRPNLLQQYQTMFDVALSWLGDTSVTVHFALNDTPEQAALPTLDVQRPIDLVQGADGRLTIAGVPTVLTIPEQYQGYTLGSYAVFDGMNRQLIVNGSAITWTLGSGTALVNTFAPAYGKMGVDLSTVEKLLSGVRIGTRYYRQGDIPPTVVWTMDHPKEPLLLRTVQVQVGTNGEAGVNGMVLPLKLANVDPASVTKMLTYNGTNLEKLTIGPRRLGVKFGAAEVTFFPDGNFWNGLLGQMLPSYAASTYSLQPSSVAFLSHYGQLGASYISNLEGYVAMTFTQTSQPLVEPTGLDAVLSIAGIVGSLFPGQ